MRHPSLFGLIDCNNFYVSCERLFNPRLEGKPVVVLSNQDGCIVSRSNEAKKLNIKMAEPIFKIKDIIKLHNVICLSSNFTLYASLSNKVMQCLSGLVPAFEVYSIDEAFLDLSGLSPDAVKTLAQQIVETVYRWTGIPVSLGIGQTKTLAKAANWHAKKNLKGPQYFMIHEANQRQALAQLPVEDVWGIGKKWAPQLAKLGLSHAYLLSLAKASDIQALANKGLARTVSELQGKPIHNIETAVPSKKQIISSRSFGREVTDILALKEAIAYHVSRGLEKLRKQNSVAKTLCVFIQTHRFRSHFEGYHYPKNIELLLPSQHNPDFLKKAMKAVEDLYIPGLSYKKAGIVLGDISEAGKGQFDLFAPSNAKENHLSRTVDYLNQRWGAGTLRYAIENFHSKWAEQRMNCSPHYTTQWAELPVVKAY